MKYLVIVDTASTGVLFFGPYATEEKAQHEAEKFERAAARGAAREPVDWSVEELQPGGYAPEWRRIMREKEPGNV